MVLKQAGEHFNSKTIKKLNSILKVHHLGVDKKDIVKKINTKPSKLIVFNHRTHSYKNYNNFIKITDRLWKERKDFKVWIPLLDGKPNKPYIVNDRGDKDFYYKRLQECCVGFSPKQKYGGWSVATTDGMMNGVPYIMFDEKYYQELCPEADFFNSDDKAVELLNKYLDDKKYRNSKSQSILKYTKKHLLYKDTIKEMSNYINELVLSNPTSTGTHLNEEFFFFLYF